jgi:hypothetical protein
MANYDAEKALISILVAMLVIVVFYGVLKLRKLQALYDEHLPAKAEK